MAEEDLRKPANRPSRRQNLIEAAVELFALQPWEFVTVTDIVERAGMTPAAFYYHFSSREQLLEEIVQTFAEYWSSTIERLLAAAETPEALASVPAEVLDEMQASEKWAMIFFLSSATAPQLVDRIRRDARNRLIRSATKAIRRLDPDRPAAELMVSGVAMIVLYETAVRSQLALDESYRTLGPRRFREELTSLSRVTTGFRST
jgi:AcrR family transcriptional regulator